MPAKEEVPNPFGEDENPSDEDPTPSEELKNDAFTTGEL
jgi:hypothetical protein